MTEALVGLGGNLGDRKANLAEALRRIDEVDGLAVLAVSRAVESEPWGVTEQPAFANAVAVVRSDLSADVLLEWLLGIEDEMGRDRNAVRNGPRVIDLDLLLFGDEEWMPRDPASGLPDPTRLTLPHPRMLEREFVMRPLLEVAPGATLPDGRPLAGLLDGATQGRVTGDLGGIEWHGDGGEGAPGEAGADGWPGELEAAELAAMDAPGLDEQPDVWWDPDEEWVTIWQVPRHMAGAIAGMWSAVKQLHDAGVPATLDPPDVFGRSGAVPYIVDQPVRLVVPASFEARAREVAGR